MSERGTEKTAEEWWSLLTHAWERGQVQRAKRMAWSLCEYTKKGTFPDGVDSHVVMTTIDEVLDATEPFND